GRYGPAERRRGPRARIGGGSAGRVRPRPSHPHGGAARRDSGAKPRPATRGERRHPRPPGPRGGPAPRRPQAPGPPAPPACAGTPGSIRSGGNTNTALLGRGAPACQLYPSGTQPSGAYTDTAAGLYYLQCAGTAGGSWNAGVSPCQLYPSASQLSSSSTTNLG